MIWCLGFWALGFGVLIRFLGFRIWVLGSMRFGFGGLTGSEWISRVWRRVIRLRDSVLNLGVYRAQGSGNLRLEV